MSEWDWDEVIGGLLGIAIYIAIWFVSLYCVVRFIKWVWYA